MADNTYAWDADQRLADRNRRSIYVLAKRNFSYPLFAAFDQPDRVNSCPTRATTITAPQALAMLNGEFALAQAKCLSRVLLAAHGHNSGQLIRTAYLRTFHREPDRDEIELAKKFLERQSRALASNDGIDASFAVAVADFCHALLNSAEFLDVE
jgi:hypothetical protein